MKKSILNLGLSGFLVFSLVTPIAAAKISQPVITIQSSIATITGYTYGLSGDMVNDIKIVFDSITREDGKITVARGKIINGKDSWNFKTENFKYDGEVYQSPTSFTKINGNESITRDGELAIDSKLNHVSGFIEDQFESIQFTGGKNAISPADLKSYFIKNNIGQNSPAKAGITAELTNSPELVNSPILVTEDPTSIPAEEDQSLSSTDPATIDEYATSLSAETNIRSTISTDYVYAHMVGPATLSRSANYSKYTVRAWLKNKYDNTNLTPRYQYSYVNPVDYSSGGGVSISAVYPKSDSSSPVSISVAYKAISASMNFDSEAAYEVSYTGQSYVRNFDLAYPPSDYWLNYDSGYDGVEGVGANFYTDMMGASTVGNSYKVNWSVKWKIWDRNNYTYFEQGGSGYYYVKASS